jgi:hypothetical protein
MPLTIADFQHGTTAGIIPEWLDIVPCHLALCCSKQYNQNARSDARERPEGGDAVNLSERRKPALNPIGEGSDGRGFDYRSVAKSQRTTRTEGPDCWELIARAAPRIALEGRPMENLQSPTNEYHQRASWRPPQPEQIDKWAIHNLAGQAPPLVTVPSF